jgi:hypothetical protein
MVPVCVYFKDEDELKLDSEMARNPNALSTMKALLFVHIYKLLYLHKLKYYIKKLICVNFIT